MVVKGAILWRAHEGALMPNSDLERGIFDGSSVDLQGHIDQDSGEVELFFDAEFNFNAGQLYKVPSPHYNNQSD